MSENDDAQRPEEPTAEARAAARKVIIEHFGDQQRALDAKFARIRSLAGEVENTRSAAIASALKGVQDTSRQTIGDLLGIHDAEEVVPTYDFEAMPDFRAAKAAELTAERLGLLADATLKAAEDSARRDELVDRRETKMLRWTIAGVLLAAVAAVASVVTLFLT